MSTAFSMVRDITGQTTYVLPFCDPNYTYKATLTSAGGVKSLTLPQLDSSGQAWAVIISASAGGNFYVAKNATPTVPTSSFAISVGELNVAPKQAFGGDILNFLTSDSSCDVQVSLYAIQR